LKIKRHLVEAPVNDIDKIAELSGKELQNAIIGELNKNKFNVAAQYLKGLTEKQFEYFAQCIGKNALGDDDNIFLNFLNNPYAARVTLKDFRTFTKAYNTLIDITSIIRDTGDDHSSFLKWIKWGNPDNCIVFDPNLYSRNDSINQIRDIIKLDRKWGKVLGESLIFEDNGWDRYAKAANPEMKRQFRQAKKSYAVTPEKQKEIDRENAKKKLAVKKEKSRKEKEAKLKAEQSEQERKEAEKKAEEERKRAELEDAKEKRATASDLRNKLRDALKNNDVDKFLRSQGVSSEKDDPAWMVKEKSKLKGMSSEERLNYIKANYPNFDEGQRRSILRSMGF